jgi:hypothetical protein
LSPHLKEKLENLVFSDVSQVLQRALNCESRAKESRSFPRSNDKPRNECHINMVEYSSESLNDEEADMCVAEWSWGFKSKPFVCSSMKSASKSWQYEMCYTFGITKCDRIFNYLLQEKNYQVIMLYHRRNSLKSMLIVNGIILILMLLMIVIFSVDRFNWP